MTPIGPASPAPESPALDDTAESGPDTAATAAAFSKRAEVALLVQQARQQQVQGRLDRMKADFNQRAARHGARTSEKRRRGTQEIHRDDLRRSRRGASGWKWA